MRSLVILATGIGMGGSAAVTYRAHRQPMSPQWDERVGDTRFRRSDLPIGGAVAMTLALGSLVTGHRKAAAVLAGAGVGATLGSLGVAVLEPLSDPQPQVDDPAAAAVVWTSDAGSASGLAGATSATAAGSDDALGGLGTSAAAPPSDDAPAAASAEFDDDDQFEHQFEEAEAVVEHQASYGSPSTDDMGPDWTDEAATEPEITGSAPQEGQPSGQDAPSDGDDA